MNQKYVDTLLRTKLSSYEFEVLMTDIYYLYLLKVKNKEVQGITVTQPTKDGGIDSILFEDSTKEVVLLQISKNIKNNSSLENFMKNDNVFMYKDLISQKYMGIRRVVLTLDKSRVNISKLKVIDEKRARLVKTGEVEIIDKQTLIMMVIEGFKYIGIIEADGSINKEKEKLYLHNISIKADFWRIAHNYRKKKSFRLKANAQYYLSVLSKSWDYLLTKDLETVINTLKLVEHRESEFAYYVMKNREKNEKISYKDIDLMRIMFMIYMIADVKYNEQLIMELVKLILESIDYNLNDFEIKAGCRHISLKDKEKDRVIAYFTYQSTLPDVKKYHYRFYCSMLDIKIPSKYKDRIFDSLEGTNIEDEWNLRQTCYLINPNVRFDKDIISELLRVSLAKYKLENKEYA